MLTKTEQNIIQKFGGKLVKDLASVVPSATGATADSIRFEATDTGFIVFGGEQIQYIIDGRGPTKAGAAKGKPTVQQMIFDWIKAKSITPKESNMSQLSLSWAIAKSIHKNGYKGKGDIFKGVLTAKRFDSLASMILEEKAINLQSSILKQFKL